MLKAVRFDLEEHAELIEFVENYRDKKNKPNHSEAIRLLMSKGLDAMNKPVETQPAINIESIKAEIFNQIMAQINTINLTPPPQHRVPIENIAPPIKQKPSIQPAVEVPKSAALNPLLANILGNSNR